MLPDKQVKGWLIPQRYLWEVPERHNGVKPSIRLLGAPQEDLTMPAKSKLASLLERQLISPDQKIYIKSWCTQKKYRTLGGDFKLSPSTLSAFLGIPVVTASCWCNALDIVTVSGTKSFQIDVDNLEVLCIKAREWHRHLILDKF